MSKFMKLELALDIFDNNNLVCILDVEIHFYAMNLRVPIKQSNEVSLQDNTKVSFIYPLDKFERMI